ncbi:hypothetical protein [Wolbachia endosymbiont of Drosophila barbarae]|uniref:hypothetical protein n=1 Tax=Wolbachia endosymbiont of Drosophila barbarae TaxID=3377043 RepID=UPI00381326AD
MYVAYGYLLHTFHVADAARVTNAAAAAAVFTGAISLKWLPLLLLMLLLLMLPVIGDHLSSSSSNWHGII